VAISGFEQPVVGEIPVIKVRRITSENASAAVGIADMRYVPLPKATETANPGDKKAQSIFTKQEILPGDYLTIVTLGAYSSIKVDASFEAIKPGSLLVASPNPGFAMASVNPRAGTIIGKALEALESGVGLIPVLITLQ
jgi:hypothetical protein